MGLPYLCPGAEFSFQGVPVRVRGTIWLNEDGDVWQEHRLEGPPQDMWITVEEGEYTRWTRRPDLDHLAEQGRRISADDDTFTLDEQGTAGYQAQGDTETAPTGTVRYRDYEGRSGALLSFESFDGGPWEAATGRELSAQDFDTLR